MRIALKLLIFILVATAGLIVLRFILEPRYLAKDQPSIIKSFPEKPIAEQTLEIVGNVNNWPIYTSTALGVSFRYRPDLTVTEPTKSSISLSYKGKLEPYEKLFSATIALKDNKENYSASEYVGKVICNSAVEIKSVITKVEAVSGCQKLVKENLKPYQMGSFNGYKTMYNLYEWPTIAITTNNKNKILILTSSGETGSEGTETGIKIIDLILSTLKFID